MRISVLGNDASAGYRRSGVARTALRTVALAAAATVGACGVQAQTPSTTPTFNADIAPILFGNCVTCHRPGNIAPMSLLSYAQARAYAPRIREMVTTHAMPPWYADPMFGTFKNARGLSQRQIDTLTAWVDGSTPEGVAAPPPPPTFQDAVWNVQLNRPPDQILELPFGEYQLPARGEVPTFSVWMKLPIKQDRFVQAIEIRPSINGALHHSSMALAKLPQGTRIGRGEAFPGGPILDGVPVYADGRPFRATSGEEFGRPVMFYVPGGGVLQFPDGLAKQFRQDDYLAWGLHMISRGKPETLRVQVGLWYARREPHHEVQTWTVNDVLMVEGREIKPDAKGNRSIPNIPAGASSVAMTGILKVPEDITIYSLWPHMHYRGKDMTFVLTEPNGRQTTLLSVPRYNPHWQLTYELAKPLKVKRGSTLTASGHYDNSAANPFNPDPNAEVRFGPQGTDEMYIPFIEVSVDDRDLRFDRLRLP